MRKNNQVKNFNDVLKVFGQCCDSIVQKCTKEIEEIEYEGLKMMNDEFERYKKEKSGKNSVSSCQNTHDDCFSFQQKPLIIDPPTKIQKKSQNSKTYFLSITKQYQPQIEKKFGKMTLEKELEDDLLFDQESGVPNKKVNALSSKSIAEICEKSNRKFQPDPESEQDETVYPMTDFSSNESSNDGGDFEQHYKFEEENLPLFPGIQKIKSNDEKSFEKGFSLFPSKTFDGIGKAGGKKELKFSPINLLKSPSKQNKKKRLFIGEKKVPRWAQNLQQIQNKLQFQSSGQVFGQCRVQHLDTNIIFNLMNGIERTSSAKWNPYSFLI